MPVESDTKLLRQAVILCRNVSYLHVFVYSERPDTKATAMPDKVNRHEAERRSKILMHLSQMKREEFYRKHIGQKRNVIFEQKEKAGTITGFTDNYIKVAAPYDRRRIGQCVEVDLTGWDEAGYVTGNLDKIE